MATIIEMLLAKRRGKVAVSGRGKNNEVSPETLQTNQQKLSQMFGELPEWEGKRPVFRDGYFSSPDNDALIDMTDNDEVDNFIEKKKGKYFKKAEAEAAISIDEPVVPGSIIDVLEGQQKRVRLPPLTLTGEPGQTTAQPNLDLRTKVWTSLSNKAQYGTNQDSAKSKNWFSFSDLPQSVREIWVGDEPAGWDMSQLSAREQFVLKENRAAARKRHG